MKITFRTLSTLLGVALVLGGCSNPVGYWKMNGDVIDGSPFQNDGIAYHTRNVEGGCNQALGFDGASSNVLVPYGEQYEFAHAMTVEAWVRLDGDGTGGPRIVEQSVDESWGLWLPLPWYESDKVQFTIVTTDGAQAIVSNGALEREAWTHITATYDGAKIRLYLDGALDNEVAHTGDVVQLGTDLAIGRNAVRDQDHLEGAIDEVRLWNRVKTRKEILHGMYDDVAFDPGLVGYWGFDGEVVDSSEHANFGIASHTTSVEGKIDQALFFDGSSSRVSISHTEQYDFGQAMTIEAWVRLDGDGTGGPRIVEQSVDESWGLWLPLPWHESDKVQFTIVTTDGAQAVVSNGALEREAWTHIAATYDGARMRLYLDGVLDNEVAHTGDVVQLGTDLSIGRNASRNLDHFEGAIDEVRLWNVARTHDEIISCMGNELEMYEN